MKNGGGGGGGGGVNNPYGIVMKYYIAAAGQGINHTKFSVVTCHNHASQ